MHTPSERGMRLHLISLRKASSASTQLIQQYVLPFLLCHMSRRLFVHWALESRLNASARVSKYVSPSMLA